MPSYEVKNCIADRALMTEYLRAKIKCIPSEYTLSTRLITEPVIPEDKLVFFKGCHTESDLAFKLELDPKAPIKLTSTSKYLDTISFEDWDHYTPCIFNYNYFSVNTYIEYNNTYFTVDMLTEFINRDKYTEEAYKEVSKADILHYDKLYFYEAFLGLCSKLTSTSSLIPYLLYNLTEFVGKYKLKDYINLKPLLDKVEAKELIVPMYELARPFIFKIYNTGIFTLDTTKIDLNIFEYSIRSAKVMSRYDGPLSVTDVWAGITKAVPEEFLKVLCTSGLLLTLIYLPEILFQMSKLPKDYYTAVAKMLSYRKPSKIIEKYFYTTSAGDFELNLNLSANFYEDNDLRFEAFKDYTLKIIKDLGDLKSELPFQDTELSCIIATLVEAANAHAWKKFRLDIATVLFTAAKKEGILRPEDYEITATSSSGASGGLVENSDELVDFSTLSFNSKDSPVDEEMSKNIEKRTTSRPEMLDTADALKKNLKDSVYDFDVKRIPISNKYLSSYRNISSKLNLETVSLIKQIRDIRTYNTGGKMNGLTSGKLDMKNLHKYKTTSKIFCRNTYKIKEMDLAFGIILDQSGSMCGQKIADGRAAMILLHDTLNALNINHAIMGHDSNSNMQSNIYRYWYFNEEKEHNLGVPTELAVLNALSGNCDSGALYYMEQLMKGVRNKDKIVMIFSDGQPTECTDKDLRDQVAHMEKNGIHVIGIGINFDSIKSYYPDNANGKDLKDMTKIIVSILKRYVLEKKE